MKGKSITIPLYQAIQLRAALNTSANALIEVAQRQRKGLQQYGCLYHEGKADELLRLGKIIDKKIKKTEDK